MIDTDYRAPTELVQHSADRGAHISAMSLAVIDVKNVLLYMFWLLFIAP
jgi:hypothetical protein